jgi:flagellar basal body-associated protein FliL
MKEIDGIKLDNLWRERDGLGADSNNDNNKSTTGPTNNGSNTKTEPTDDEVKNIETTSRPAINTTNKPATMRAPKLPKNIDRKKILKIALIVAIILIIGGLATSVALLYQENQHLRDPQYVATEAKKADDDLLSKISLHIQLPTSDPVIYTVSNKEAEDSTQMATSLGVTLENNDKIVIYSEDKTFVVYRPGEDRIVKSGPIAITATTEDQAAIEGSTQ